MIPVASIIFALLDVLDLGFRQGKVMHTAGRIGALVIAFGIPAGLQDSGE